VKKLNDIKCIVNKKDCYIDGKNMNTDMRYIPKLQEASRTEVVVGGGAKISFFCQLFKKRTEENLTDGRGVFFWSEY
jgi:hypothetical protein